MPATVRYFLDGLNQLRTALSGSNGTTAGSSTTAGVTMFDIDGNPIGAGNPSQVQDLAAEASLAQIQAQTQQLATTVGTQADAPWAGTGNGTDTAILKAIALGVATPSTGKVQIQGGGSTNLLTENTDGSTLDRAMAIVTSSTTALVNGAQAQLQTDINGCLWVNSTPSNGVQGTGSQYNPPTGGSGPLGYLSGLLWALTNPAGLTVTIAAGVAQIGSVVLAAGSALIGKFQLADSGGTNLLTINSSGAASVQPTPLNTAGAFSSVSVGTSSGLLLAAGSARKFLQIVNPSKTTMIWINIGGAAAVGAGIPITPLGSYTREGNFVPSDIINAIVDTGGSSFNVTVGAA